MQLSVIIVNYNVKYYLEQCLFSVFASIDKNHLDAEVFVVDNNSSDRSVEYLRPKFSRAVFIENKENAGFSKANNLAIEQASGKFILLLNPDTVIGEDTLPYVCRFMEEHPDAGGVGVKMIDGYGRFLPESKRGFPSPWNSFCKMTGLSKLFPYSPFFAKYHLRYLNENEVHRVDVLSGAFMLLRKQTLDKVGLLDETFFMYGEDIDLSYRIILGGYHNYYLPEKIIHYKGESTKKDIKYVKIFYEAMLIFFRKHFPHYNPLFIYLIRLAIYCTGGVSALSKFFFKRKRSKIKPLGNTLIIGKKEDVDQESEFDFLRPDNIIAVSAPEEIRHSDSFFEKKDINDVVFYVNLITYNDIITLMDKSRNKAIRYWNFYPATGFMIAANETLTETN